MTSSREHALALLDSLRHKLQRGGPLSLTSEERRYLKAMCDRALANDSDPLNLGRDVGGQTKANELLAEALLVHQRRKLGTLRAACESVGLEFHRDGSKSGAVEKNYKAHRAAFEAGDRFYAARASGQAPDDAEVRAILQGKARGK